MAYIVSFPCSSECTILMLCPPPGTAFEYLKIIRACGFSRIRNFLRKLAELTLSLSVVDTTLAGGKFISLSWRFGEKKKRKQKKTVTFVRDMGGRVKKI